MCSFALDIVVSAMLLTKEENKRILIYFISHVLVGLELNYLKIEMLALQLVVTTRKLRPSFKARILGVLILLVNVNNSNIYLCLMV